MTVFAEIDADEFDAAMRDPKVLKLLEDSRKYAEHLVSIGHCPTCLVINCEHMD